MKIRDFSTTYFLFCSKKYRKNKIFKIKILFLQIINSKPVRVQFTSPNYPRVTLGQGKHLRIHGFGEFEHFVNPSLELEGRPQNYDFRKIRGGSEVKSRGFLRRWDYGLENWTARGDYIKFLKNKILILEILFFRYFF